jgi:hypothetical protein
MAVIVVQLSQTTSQKQNTMIRLDPFLIGMDGDFSTKRVSKRSAALQGCPRGRGGRQPRDQRGTLG